MSDLYLIITNIIKLKPGAHSHDTMGKHSQDTTGTHFTTVLWLRCSCSVLLNNPQIPAPLSYDNMKRIYFNVNLKNIVKSIIVKILV